MKRLEFLQKAGTVAVMSATGISLVHCNDDDVGLELEKSITIDLDTAPFNELKTEGAWLLHPDHRINVLLINVNGQIRAFSSVCPHQQCTRQWAYSPGVLTCNCHNSKFDSTGQFLSGPANANLRQLAATREENMLTVG